MLVISNDDVLGILTVFVLYNYTAAACAAILLPVQNENLLCVK